MKKKIAFLMASIMSLSMMPTINSYASSDNKLSNGNVTVSEKTMFYEAGTTKPQAAGNSKVKYFSEANYLNIKLEDDIVSSASHKVSFGLELTNAKFAFADWNKYATTTPINEGKGELKNGVYTRYNGGDSVGYSLTTQSDDYAVVELNQDATAGETIRIPLIARMDENLTKGEAKVRVDATGSGLSSNSLLFATISKGSTNAYVEDAQTGKNKIAIQKLVIKENVAGSMNPADGDGFYLELPSGYYFRDNGVEVKGINVGLGEVTRNFENGNRKFDVTFKNFMASEGRIGQITITGLEIIPNSSSDTITKEDVNISIDNIGSSDMVTSQEFTAGTRADYSMSFKTDGTVPTLLNGFYDTSSYTNDRTKSVKVIVSEETAGSLINGGDLVLTLSDRAKIRGVKIEDKENIEQAINGTYELGKTYNNVEVKDSKVTLRGIANSSSTEKAKFTISFYLSVEAGFVGDVTMSVSGDAIRNSASVEPVVIAKTINPLTADVQTSYIQPGQTVELSDIVLTEQMDNKGYSALESGKTIVLGINNNNNYLSVVGTPTIKTENGLTVKNVKTSSTNVSGSALSFTIDDASSRNKASKITISGLKIATSAATPQGTYTIVAGGNAIAGNSTAIIGSNSDVASFSAEGIAVAKLQYGGKVTMKITIGDKMVTVNGQNIEMKLAPFIDAKTGTTYMQVSDIVRATGKTCTFFDNRVQNVEGMDKTLFVTFGDRTFEKDKSIVKIAGQTIPETMTNEQGQAVNMIIKDDYTCLPLRYFVERVLGQTINWNGTDNTITVE